MPKNQESKDQISLAYRLVRYCGKVLALWPPDQNEKWYGWIFQICWWILMINGTFLILGIIIGTYQFYRDIESFTTLIFIVYQITLIAENMYTSLFFKFRRKQLQVLISFLENNLMKVNSPEEILFRKYLKSGPITIFIYSIFVTLTVGFTYLLLFKLTLILPKEVWFPIPIKSDFKKYVLLIQQLIYYFHTGVLHIADEVMFMLILISTAKLEVLCHEFEQVTNEDQLNKCIKKHQEIIWFFNKIRESCSHIILKTMLATASYVILAYLQLLNRHAKIDSLVLYQFFGCIILVNYRMFCGSKYADDLAMMGDNLRFSMPWVGKSSGLSRSMNIIIHRCQKTLTLSVTGIISKYNLDFYSHFISFTFSYFLTLKAVLRL